MFDSGMLKKDQLNFLDTSHTASLGRATACWGFSVRIVFAHLQFDQSDQAVKSRWLLTGEKAEIFS